jgi:acetyl esterase/lipase
MADYQKPKVTVRENIAYTTHDGVTLLGDLYLPEKPSSAVPVLIAVHGGGWERGDRKSFRNWGDYLPRHGYGLFAIQYRLAKPGTPAYPQAVHNVCAAVRFVRSNASELGTDDARIGLFGLSAGGHLAALAALAGGTPRFLPGTADEPHAGIGSKVKVAVVGYGIFDAAAHWNSDLSSRPGSSTLQQFLGTSLVDDRELYFQASPLSYVTRNNNKTAFLVTYGMEDEVVDPHTQSKVFVKALSQAGFFVRSMAVPGAGHFWLSDPLDETGSHSGLFAPRLLRFLAERL